jgi:hypothetical protein
MNKENDAPSGTAGLRLQILGSDEFNLRDLLFGINGAPGNRLLQILN